MIRFIIGLESALKLRMGLKCKESRQEVSLTEYILATIGSVTLMERERGREGGRERKREREREREIFRVIKLTYPSEDGSIKQFS
jgi:hypothetical protein